MSFLEVVRALLVDPDAKEEFRADPDGYLEARGFDVLATDELADATGFVADTLPAAVAVRMAAPDAVGSGHLTGLVDIEPSELASLGVGAEAAAPDAGEGWEGVETTGAEGSDGPAGPAERSEGGDDQVDEQLSNAASHDQDDDDSQGESAEEEDVDADLAEDDEEDEEDEEDLAAYDEDDVPQRDDDDPQYHLTRTDVADPTAAGAFGVRYGPEDTDDVNPPGDELGHIGLGF